MTTVTFTLNGTAHTIEVRTEVGRGPTFVLGLPWGEPPRDPDPADPEAP